MNSGLAASIAAAYGLTVSSVRHLPGESENYQVATPEGARFVLKIADETRSRAEIELEHAATEAAHAGCPDLKLPRFVPTIDGGVVATIEVDGTARLARLLGYVEGRGWSDAPPLPLEACRALGRTIASLDLALASLSDPAARRTHQWDPARAGQHWSRIELIDDVHRRRTASRAFMLWAAAARPHLDDLPRALIHGDLNDENVRVIDATVCGVLDFGDCLENPVICELAVALAYLLLDRDDPLAVGAAIVAGYHEVRPLWRLELEVLFPLVCGRLAASVVIAAGRRRQDPSRSSWFVTEDRAWRALERYVGMSAVEAGRRLASGTGVPVFEESGVPPGELRARRQAHVSSALSLSYREPLALVRGRGQYLFDETGWPHLDLYNNVAHVGHCHPRVVEAAHRQMARLNTNTRYLYEALAAYAERLCATLPPPLRYCFFLNSGSEANELALRLARTHTGRHDVIVLDAAYHGHTTTLVSISPYKFKAPGGAGLQAPWVRVAPVPDGYRGRHRGSDRRVGQAYGDEVGAIVRSAPAPVAAFLAESMPSCAGQIVPPEGYFETAFRHVREAGGVCILDEVQTGFGRVGTHFWAFERQNVVPDIVVMGKPIGNGHPLAAVVTTPEIADSFGATGLEFFSTFGGNPVSCAVGIAVLDVIRDERLQARAEETGAELRDGLAALMDRRPIIGDVRGAGLFIGVELVRSRETLEPASAEASALVNALRRRRVLTGTDGPFRNVVKIKGPMVLSRDDVAMALAAVDEVLTAGLDREESVAS